FWVLAGALVPPAPAATRPTGSATAAVILASAIVATLGAVRSATSLGAMGLVNASTRLSALESAETLDPGSYRIRVRLAQAFLGRGDCARSKPHSRAAHDLFPNAAEPRRLLAECGAK